MEYRIVKKKNEYLIYLYTRFGGKYQPLWVERCSSKYLILYRLLRDIIKYF